MRYKIPLVLIVSYLCLILASPVSSQSASVSVRLENNNTCGRNVIFSLSGFTPNSPITVDNNPDRIREYECNGQLKQGAGWRGWNIGVNTDGNGNATVSVTHGAYGSYEYIFYDAGGRSAAISFEYSSANSQPPPPPPPQPPPGDNQRSGMDLNAFCVSRGFASVERTREGSDSAYSHLCRSNDGSFHAIDMRDVCQFQYSGRLPHVSLGSAGDPGSWNCNSQPQSQPSGGYITYGGNSSPPPAPPPSPTCPTAQSNLALGVIARVNTPQLNVRSDPRSDANRLFQLNQGTLVTIVSGPSCSGGVRWWQIGTSDGRGGWSAEVGSSGSYLLVPNSADNPVQPPPQPPAPPQPPIDNGSATPIGELSVQINAPAGLNIRSGPGTNFAVLAKAAHSRYFEVNGQQQNGWYPIRFSGGTGWVSGDYVILAQGSAPVAPGNPFPTVRSSDVFYGVRTEVIFEFGEHHHAVFFEINGCAPDGYDWVIRGPLYPDWGGFDRWEVQCVAELRGLFTYPFDWESPFPAIMWRVELLPR